MNKLNRGVTTDTRHITYDIVGNALIFVLCHTMFYGLGWYQLSLLRTTLVSLCFLCFYILMCKDLKLYDTTTFFYSDRVIRRITTAFLLSVALVATIMYFMGRAKETRVFYIAYFLASYVGFLALSYVSYKLNKSERASTRTLLVGTLESYRKLQGFMDKTNLSMNIIGFVKYERSDPEEEEASGYLGFTQDGNFEELLHRYTIDQVYLLQEAERYRSMYQCLNLCTRLGVITHVVIPPMQLGCASYISSIGTYPVLTYHMVSLDAFQRLLKRILDVCGSIVGIILSAPFLLVAAIAIKLDSPGPVFFRQSRVGLNGRTFNIYKLRTMHNDAEARKKELEQQNEMEDGFMFKIRHDPRITRVGRVLRKTSIDELPQFFNVLKGDMSLVGTRPPTKNEVEKYETHHWRRLSVKPGITGLWQTSGRNDITDFNEVVALDTKYIENWSIWLDIKLILKTVGVLFTRKGAH